jgi:S-formylglutathione hydrolase
MTALETLSESACFGGVQGFYRGASAATRGPMRFGLFRPEASLRGVRVPLIVYLAGLTCNEETGAIKAGAQRLCAELGLALLTPDTSPREPRFPGDDASWDFGLGAGFYVDATEDPWAGAYRMFTHVTAELPDWLASFSVDTARQAITGHSMGGHGALVCALRLPSRYRAVSAFAPITNPSAVPWGQKAFSRYLGQDPRAWAAYDASALLAQGPFPGTILIDQGLSDKFLERELSSDAFERAAEAVKQPLLLRKHPGYDHSYWFVSSFMPEHLRHLAQGLGVA